MKKSPSKKKSPAKNKSELHAGFDDAKFEKELLRRIDERDREQLAALRAQANAEDKQDAKVTRSYSGDPLKLTGQQIMLLMDNLLCACNDDSAVTTPLMVLMNDVARNSYDQSHVETVAAMVTRCAYSNTKDADEREADYIARKRAETIFLL